MHELYAHIGIILTATIAPIQQTFDRVLAMRTTEIRRWRGMRGDRRSLPSQLVLTWSLSQT